MKIIQTKRFATAGKKLHKNQKLSLDAAIRHITQNPAAGELKKGDLSSVLVYKFRMVNQLTLLAYMYDDNVLTLTLLALGTHENFYCDLKN
jgi:hypothetical protein